ncbi:cAMP-dependent protein kinase catalytic subunit PRKX-like isoform X1 [Ruditapes philippinarum]|uniref:cAMP-dependent protein kinase catalytic subunit PRKX-like isoform X1 n=1 Tax=Ruditapes philippinarum TaxID=129788 RepID=UPI00295B1EAE|nr:cAMP-dependent protein kinase catalytic subunit PRKX-like isoform X1 [Ruditapes philippinarum]
MASAKVAKVKKQTSPTGKKGSENTEEGKKLSDYEILSTIGTGTFGRVVLARNRETRNYFALKVMAITDVIRLRQVEHVTNEKEILSSITHPFIVNMFWANHDDTFLYMLMEYVPGGEVFSYLRNYGRFSNTMANFYASEIVSALEYLHSRSIVYRDLKPENLLLDRDGHLKITDFGFAKKLLDRTWTLCGTPEYLAPEIIQSKGYNKAVDWWALGILLFEMIVGTWTLCGTPEYLAPEIIQSKGHSKAVDWWSLGILIFEMIVGFPPFFDDQPFGIYEKILSGKIDWPRHLDPVVKDLIKKLLVPDRTKRLGNMKNGAEDVKKHKWFKSIEWEDVLARKLTPPIIPKVAHEGDTKNFDTYPEDEWQKTAAAGEKDIALFVDF